ncbi:hypothetical protein J6590_077341, partial [Homalodisca vitripennis]
DHQRVQLREEPIWRVTLEQLMRIVRRCQTCPLCNRNSPVLWQRRGACSFYWSPPIALFRGLYFNDVCFGRENVEE